MDTKELIKEAKEKIESLKKEIIDKNIILSDLIEQLENTDD